MVSRIEGEGRCVIWVRSISNEAARGMGVESEHKEECEMVGVPECLKALTTNAVMRG